jgi:hypothetical protein
VEIAFIGGVQVLVYAQFLLELELCRKLSIPLIAAWADGYYGMMTSDFGDKYEYKR